MLLSRIGGLSTNLKTLKANLFLSSTVAFIGIACPIGLSFGLLGLLDITPLQAFAAGAALCSTSLGTTFTVLSTSGLTESRLGVILSSAAMMDDVVGLVMVQVISNLGQASFDVVTVVRPILVSIAFTVVLPLVCRFVVQPLTGRYHPKIAGRDKKEDGSRAFETRRLMVLVHTAILLALVTGSTYAGTSNLFAAYLAGVVIAWWSDLSDSMALKTTTNSGEGQTEVQEPLDSSNGDETKESATGHSIQHPSSSKDKQDKSSQPHDNPTSSASGSGTSGISIYECYFGPAISLVLKPFFFASIGFAIPITQMFSGGVVWRGLVYTLLMAFGKFLCGACLVRFSGPLLPKPSRKKYIPTQIWACWPIFGSHSKTNAEPSRTQVNTTEQPASRGEQKHKTLPKPQSLYPAAILGNAMIARGEIGFLISSIAESKGIFKSQASGGSSELFLVVTWAILLCTIFGPVAVGLLVKRVKRLQRTERSHKTGRDDPLGIWGVTPNS